MTIIKRELGEDVQESNQESNQGGNQGGNQESNQETPVKISLSKSQKDIANFCSVPRTAQEILDRLGVTNQSINRKRHIQPLLDMGVLEMTIPDNPKNRNQKYRRKRK